MLMIVKLWIKGAYIRGSANDLSRQNINERLPKEALFFMVSLAYLVKRRSVEPENRVRSPEIPKIYNLIAQLDRASVYGTEG